MITPKFKDARVKWTEATPGNPVGIINGDGMRLQINTNHHSLEIVGDGCHLIIDTNHGKIKMVGDGSKLEIIEKNTGDIEYHGDGGRIMLGKDCALKTVHYVGDGGRVGFKTGDTTVTKTCRTFGRTNGVGIRKTMRLKESNKS